MEALSTVKLIIAMTALATAGATHNSSLPLAGTPSLTAYESSKSVKGYVWRVLDGDTVQVKTAKGIATVRLAGIDAPEKRQPGGLLSAQMLSMLVLGQPIRVNIYDKDRYGRLVADLSDVKGTVSFNLLMVCLGYAWAAQEKYLIDDRPVRCEVSARDKKLGIWAWRVKHQAPWRWRRDNK